MDRNEARRYLFRLLEDGFQFAHVAAGINAGLFEALIKRGEQGSSPHDLAKELGYHEDYVRFWCEYGYSRQILDYAGDDRFCLAEAFRPLLTPGAPGALVAGFWASQIMVEEQLQYPEFLRTGAVWSFTDHGERLTKAVADGTVRFAEIIIEEVYGSLPDVRQKLEQGACFLEVGCGKGRILPMLAGKFARSSFEGIDVDAHAIAAGQQEVEAKGLSHRIRLRRIGGESLDCHGQFDIASMFVAMHEVRPESRPRLVANLWRALRPGGVLISTDFTTRAH